MLVLSQAAYCSFNFEIKSSLLAAKLFHSLLNCDFIINTESVLSFLIPGTWDVWEFCNINAITPSFFSQIFSGQHKTLQNQ